MPKITIAHLKVREVAKQQGYSMGRLSRDAKVSYNTIKKIYNNPYKDLTVTVLVRIALALEVPLDKLAEAREVTDQEAERLKSLDKLEDD